MLYYFVPSIPTLPTVIGFSGVARNIFELYNSKLENQWGVKKVSGLKTLGMSLKLFLFFFYCFSNKLTFHTVRYLFLSLIFGKKNKKKFTLFLTNLRSDNEFE